MKRMHLLAIGLLAVVLAACGSSPASESTAASQDEAPASVEATPEATPEPPESEAAEPSEDDGTGSGEGSGTALADLLPDTIDGQSREDIDFSDNEMFSAMLQQQGVDIGDVDILLATYGTGADALGVTAVRVPDMPQANLEMLAQLMAGMPEAEASTETLTIGGKTVIAITPEGMDQVGYLYFADGAAFVVAGGTEDLAAELLSQLP